MFRSISDAVFLAWKNNVSDSIYYESNATQSPNSINEARTERAASIDFSNLKELSAVYGSNGTMAVFLL